MPADIFDCLFVCDEFLGSSNTFKNYKISWYFKKNHLIIYSYPSISIRILYSYLVGCCPISDLFSKGEQILDEA